METQDTDYWGNLVYQNLLREACSTGERPNDEEQIGVRALENVAGQQ